MPIEIVFCRCLTILLTSLIRSCPNVISVACTAIDTEIYIYPVWNAQLMPVWPSQSDIHQMTNLNVGTSVAICIPLADGMTPVMFCYIKTSKDERGIFRWFGVKCTTCDGT